MISDEWLAAMLEHAQREGVGAVGAKLLYPDKTIQHAGIIIGMTGNTPVVCWNLNNICRIRSRVFCWVKSYPEYRCSYRGMHDDTKRGLPGNGWIR